MRMAAAKVVMRMANRTATIPMTTTSSVSENPRRQRAADRRMNGNLPATPL